MANVLLVGQDVLAFHPPGDYLSRTGHRVETARTGEEALEKIRAERPDIIVSEMRLPGGDGAELMRRVAGIPGYFPGKVILAGSGDSEAWDLAATEGSSVFCVEKDRWEKELPIAIQRALELYHARLWACKQVQESGAMEEQLRILSSAVEQTADMVMITDREGNIEYVNTSFEARTGYKKEDIVGWPPSFLNSHAYSPGFYRKLWETILAGEVFSGIFINRKKNGELLYEEKTITPLRDPSGNINRFVSTAKDITDYQWAIEKLLEDHAELEAAKKADALKDDFMASISHELRSPLTAIMGFADLIPKKVAAGEAEKAAAYASMIGSSSAHLLALVNELLDYAKIKAGMMELALEELSFAEIIENLQPQFHGFLESKDLRLRIAVPANLPPVVADRVRLNQIIWNLFTNAVKFTPREGEIVISASYREEFTFMVSDTGIGIADEDKDKIFDRFMQAKRGRDGQQGTGLGLAICKKLVELHGGAIWVESGINRGSAFYFTLPANKEPARMGEAA